MKKSTTNTPEAIKFLIWCADNGWYRNGKSDEWYQIPKQNNNKTAAELYKLFSPAPSPVPDSSKDALKDAQRNACLVALEFGYIQCEKGNNLEMAILNYNKIVNQQ